MSTPPRSPAPNGRRRRAHPAKWGRRIAAGSASLAVVALTGHMATGATSTTTQASGVKISSAGVHDDDANEHDDDDHAAAIPASSSSTSSSSSGTSSSTSQNQSRTRAVTTSRGS